MVRALGMFIILMLMMGSCFAGELDNQLDQLSSQLTADVAQWDHPAGAERIRIGVVEFSNLDGYASKFGRYLVEELTTRLFRTGRFEIVERQLLDRVLQEQRLSASGLINPATAKQLGQLLGVAALITGTYIDLGERVKANARLIATETGEVAAVASVSFAKDAEINRLLKTANSGAASGSQKIPAPGPMPRLTPPPERIPETTLKSNLVRPLPPNLKPLFFDDFSIAGAFKWKMDRSQNAASNIAAGKFTYVINDNRYFHKVIAPVLLPQNYIIEAEASLKTPVNASYGFLFDEAGQSYFTFIITPAKQQLYVGRRDMADEKWYPFLEHPISEAIAIGAAKNRLRVHCQGNLMTFYINDYYIAEFSVPRRDGPYQAGLAAEASQLPAHVLFDNFKVVAL